MPCPIDIPSRSASSSTVNRRGASFSFASLAVTFTRRLPHSRPPSPAAWTDPIRKTRTLREQIQGRRGSVGSAQTALAVPGSSRSARPDVPRHGQRRRDQPAADQPVAAIGADVILVAERRRDRQVDHRRPALAGFALVLFTVQRASRSFWLSFAGCPANPPPPVSDRLLFVSRVALLGRGDDARVDQLPRHAR
jgi:hypothetical protein